HRPRPRLPECFTSGPRRTIGEPMQATDRALAVVVLTAGQGKRMQSGLAKVLHEVAGRPMLAYPLELPEALGPGRPGEGVRGDAAFAGGARFAEQSERRGTGHAVQMAHPALEGFAGDVLILYGDTPLLRVETLQRMRQVKAERRVELLILSALEPLPGRIVR